VRISIPHKSHFLSPWVRKIADSRSVSRDTEAALKAERRELKAKKVRNAVLRKRDPVIVFRRVAE